MLNLLFISDSPKADFIKNTLQPALKVIIDVVTDFDHGLKDVFEKRPTTVCIQDQIGGVSGESVARHIQMLLGNSAPTFILLHSGNGKPKAIKGLYEHLIDLSQPNEAIAEDILSTLKTLLGDQWQKIFIPPQLTPASVRSSVAVPEESREDADKLVDDFLSDLEASGFTIADEQPPAALTVAAPSPETPDFGSHSVEPEKQESIAGTKISDHIKSTSDEMAELLLAEAYKENGNKKTVEITAPDKSGADIIIDSTPKAVASSALPPSSAVLKSPPPAPTISSPGTSAAKPGASKPGIKVAGAASGQPSVTLALPAAEFRINQKNTPAEERIPEDLLLAFEKNYRSSSPFLKRGVVIALVSLACVAGGLYSITKAPGIMGFLRQYGMPSTSAKQLPVTVTPVNSVQKPVSAPLRQQGVMPQLPSFIPKQGHDLAFALKNPGWERYVGKLNEFRVFSVAGHLQAVQVLSVNNSPIAASVIKSVLHELAGSEEYHITSRNRKAGVLVESGKFMNNKGDIKFYRKKGAVKAFVVSVN
jgi:hypothetical protein